MIAQCCAESNPDGLLGVMCIQEDVNQLDSLPLFTIGLNKPASSPSLNALAGLLQQRNISENRQQLKLVLTCNLRGFVRALLTAGISLPHPSALSMLVDPLVLSRLQVYLCWPPPGYLESWTDAVNRGHVLEPAKF